MQPPLSLQKTVGTHPETCATGGHIVVKKGTTVYYCYTVTNHESFTLTTHSLVDDMLGPIALPNGGNFILAPGDSKVITAPIAGAVINVNTVNVATWTAEGTPETTDTAPSVAAEIVTVNAMNTAEVDIGAQPAPALGDAALAFVAAAMLLFGAIRLSRKLHDQA
jgi:hypothetical protein